MIQFNHMLNSSLINNLTSSVYQKQDSKQLILLANDFHKSSMFILKNLSSVVQPVSCQLPLFVSTPKDFEKHYHYYDCDCINLNNSLWELITLKMSSSTTATTTMTMEWNKIESNGK